MKHIIIGLGLFSIQIFLTFLGETFLGKALFDKYLNPIFLFGVSIAIPLYLLWISLRSAEQNMPQPVIQSRYKIIWALGGFLSVAAAYEEFRKALVKYSEPEKWSDVIPQVRTLYERFSNGEFPYMPIELPGYNLLPIYMPLHWLPAGLADPVNVDLRWIGFGFFAIAAALYGWFLSEQPGSIVSRLIALVLPSLPLWAFIRWGNVDLLVSYEIVIGAYYLLLATGLLSRKLWLITLGIIVCLLSRYTLLFWIPLFAVLLFLEKGLKKSVIMWATVAVCFLLIYFIPFYSKEPALLNKGLSYYMGATVAEWNGYGDPPVSWTHERGISFAPHMKAAFSGEMANRVARARTVHGIVMLLVFAAGWLAYLRWRQKVDLFTFSLIALDCFLVAYYFFAPLTYRYYFFSLLVISAVVCGKIVLSGTRVNQNSDPD